jgi:osmotically-inducible protein OsmY
MPNKHIPNTQIITEKKLTIMKNSIFMLLVTMLLSIPLHSQQNSVSDQAIKNNVMLELQLQPDVSSHLIDVSVDDGIVTLSGYTDNLLARDRAVKTSKSVKGVRGVLNQVMVTTPVKTDNENRSDFDIQKDIEGLLANDVRISGENISVKVNDGTAILTGTVDTWKEKENATKNAIQGGAEKVKNKLDVRAKPELEE